MGFLTAVAVMASSSLTVPLLSGGSPAVASPAAASPAAASPSGNALRRWGATMGGSQAVTAAQAVADAQIVDTLIGLPGTFGTYTAQMRAANPSLRLVYYLNGVYGTAGPYPEVWYLHDASGHRVFSRNFNNPLMDPANTDWIQSRITDCSSTLAGLHWDGCYLDMLGAGSLTPNYLTSAPINPATGALWTIGEWMTATTNLASQVTTALPGKYLVGNGLGDGAQYFDPNFGPSSMLIGPLAGGNAQGFVRGDHDPATLFRREFTWKTDVDMLVDAGQRGRSVLVQAKVWAGGITQVQKNAIHRYALATFLLGTDGKQFWYFSDTGQESAVVPDSPYDHVAIGTPIGSYAKMLGVYQRRYTKGLVLVNSTSAPVTVPLPAGQWTTLTGTVVQGQLTMAANTGDVLSTSNVWGSVPSVTTGQVSNITPTSATIAAPVNAHGLPTTVQAEFGDATTLGTLSTPVAAGSAATATTVPIDLTGLKPGTVYHYHVDATSSAGTVAGTDLTFTTPLPAPAVRTGGGVANGTTSVTVTGYVKPFGLPTTFHVEYGPDTNYGSSSAATPAGSGTTLVAESVSLTGLPSGSVVHYRFVASNSTGTTVGSDRTVRTS